MMKKYLPFALLAAGVLVLLGVFLFLKSRKAEPVEEEETVAEIPFEKRPEVSLTPTSDGHWLTLLISNITLEANSVDYELLYTLPDGRTQGVPGTVFLDGKDIERKLLLGSESSGKFRYDEGVDKGTLSLKFRDGKGKLVGKLTTDWMLLKGSDEISSSDGKLKLTLKNPDEELFFVIMNTFGVTKMPSFEPKSDPYGVFVSGNESISVGVSMDGLKVNSYRSGSDWEEVGDDFEISDGRVILIGS